MKQPVANLTMRKAKFLRVCDLAAVLVLAALLCWPGLVHADRVALAAMSWSTSTQWALGIAAVGSDDAGEELSPESYPCLHDMIPYLGEQLVGASGEERTRLLRQAGGPAARHCRDEQVALLRLALDDTDSAIRGLAVELLATADALDEPGELPETFIWGDSGLEVDRSSPASLEKVVKTISANQQYSQVGAAQLAGILQLHDAVDVLVSMGATTTNRVEAAEALIALKEVDKAAAILEAVTHEWIEELRRWRAAPDKQPLISRMLPHNDSGADWAIRAAAALLRCGGTLRMLGLERLVSLLELHEKDTEGKEERYRRRIRKLLADESGQYFIAAEQARWWLAANVGDAGGRAVVYEVARLRSLQPESVRVYQQQRDALSRRLKVGELEGKPLARRDAFEWAQFASLTAARPTQELEVEQPSDEAKFQVQDVVVLNPGTSVEQRLELVGIERQKEAKQNEGLQPALSMGGALGIGHARSSCYSVIRRESDGGSEVVWSGCPGSERICLAVQEGRGWVLTSSLRFTCCHSELTLNAYAIDLTSEGGPSVRQAHGQRASDRRLSPALATIRRIVEGGGGPLDRLDCFGSGESIIFSAHSDEGEGSEVLGQIHVSGEGNRLSWLFHETDPVLGRSMRPRAEVPPRSPWEATPQKPGIFDISADGDGVIPPSAGDGREIPKSLDRRHTSSTERCRRRHAETHVKDHGRAKLTFAESAAPAVEARGAREAWAVVVAPDSSLVERVQAASMIDFTKSRWQRGAREAFAELQAEFGLHRWGFRPADCRNAWYFALLSKIITS